MKGYIPYIQEELEKKKGVEFLLCMKTWKEEFFIQFNELKAKILSIQKNKKRKNFSFYRKKKWS